jgi:hypothetical protein
MNVHNDSAIQWNVLHMTCPHMPLHARWRRDLLNRQYLCFQVVIKDQLTLL